MQDIIVIESISKFHHLLRLPPPKHPLLSVVDFSNLEIISPDAGEEGVKVSSSFYAITMKQLKMGSLQYGRKLMDFQGGSLFFSYPNQVGVLQNAVFEQCKYNWGLFFHADLLIGTALASKMSEYSFFNYTTNEALHLSEDEQQSLTTIVGTIQTELLHPIDQHSKNVLVSAIALLLNHCNRYYDRQFITRSNENHNVIDTIYAYLKNYFASDGLSEKGLPTAIQCAELVHLSPNYLSDLLRKETGKTTQEHIHYHLLEAAKDRLLGTNHSIKEIAHNLGFEYAHYFSSLFKKKIGLSPSEFRLLHEA